MAGAAGLTALLVATWNACRDIPAHGYRTRDLAPHRETAGVATFVVQSSIVTPALLWALLGPLAYAYSKPDASASKPDASALSPQEPSLWDALGMQGAAATPATLHLPEWSTSYLLLSGGALVALLSGFAAAWLSLDRGRRAGFWENALWWLIASVAAALLLQLGIWLGRSLPFFWIAVLGPLWVIGAHVLQSTIYVGLRQASPYADLDREWLARLNADKLAPALLWAAFATTTLLPPHYLGAITWPKLLALATGPPERGSPAAPGRCSAERRHSTPARPG